MGRPEGHDETEIGHLIAEGILSREESAALLEEARRLGRSPLQLLRERGRISERAGHPRYSIRLDAWAGHRVGV